MSTKPRVMLIYPPGRMLMRGEDRCQANITASSAAAMRACNDLGYAAAVLTQGCYEVFLRDYQTEKATIDDLKKDIIAFKPDLIVLSTTNATIFEDIAIADEMKQCSNAKIAFKGADFFRPSGKLTEQLEPTNIDFLIGGELECVVGELADSIFFNRHSIDEVPFLLYKKDGKFTETNFNDFYCDLDSLPFPARKLMNNALYVRPDNGKPMATIQTSRGCSSNCIYCLSPRISGKHERLRSPENILLELMDCYDNYAIQEFFFKSDTFTMNEVWVSQICRAILDSRLKGKIHFAANSRVHPLKKETLALMKEAGCYAIAFGFESGSEETLKRIHKGTTKEQARQACEWAKQVGLLVYGFFMIGFPWENDKHLQATKEFIFELDPDFLEIFIAYPYYGTRLYQLCLDDDLISQDVYGGDFFTTQQVRTKYLSNCELVRFRKKVLTKFYLRPRYLFRKFVRAATHPRIVFNYIKFGFRLIRNTVID